MEYVLKQYTTFNLGVDELDYLKFTPLLLACYRCWDQDESEAFTARILCVRMLVEANANVNYQKRKTLLTPFHWACFNGDQQVVKYLLDHKARMEVSSLNQTPLGIAGASENFEIVDIILDDWWAKNYHGMTPDLRAMRNVSEHNKTSANLTDKTSRVAPDGEQPKRSDDQERENSFGDLEERRNVIILKYDTQSNSKNFEQQLTLRVLYWATFKGR
jgi:ankyrin repeat protein